MNQGQEPSKEEKTASDARSEHHHRGKSSESLLDKAAILEALAIELGRIVLDAGCGTGYMSKEFSRKVGKEGKVYALDPDDEAIEQLKVKTEGTNIVAFVGDITAFTPLPASVFDLIYVATVVHGFSPNQFKGFDEEVRRLLAPKGRLAVVEMEKRETPFGPPLHIRLSPGELKALIDLNPLKTVSVGEGFYMQLFGERTAR